MKQDLHPEYKPTVYECSCGNRFESMSTKGGTLHVELCDKCHPFFTGQQKLIDTGGRVQRFSDKFGAAATVTLEKDAAAKEARRKAAEEIEEAKKAAREKKAAEKAAKAAEFASRPVEPAPIVEEETMESAEVAGIDHAMAEQEAEIVAGDEAAVLDAETAGDLEDASATADIDNDAAGAGGFGDEIQP